MQNIIAKIEELNAALKKMLPMKPEFQKILDKKFRLEFNYNSNHIEGNTLTYGETELLLIFEDTKGNHTKREYDEMEAHDVAFSLVKEWAEDKERTLTETDIKNLNKIILVKPFWKEAITPDGQNTRRQIKVGDYKDFPNSVRLRNGEIFEYVSPSETRIFMKELIDWYRTEEKALHPLTLAAMLHYKFVRIHPFDDGNGRVARLIMNYVLLKNDFPPVIIKSSDKQNYLKALHLADVGNYEPFINYMAEELIWSLGLSIKAAKGDSIEEPDDLDKEIHLLQKELEGEDILKKEANYEIIYEALIENVFPLFVLVEEKLEEFKKHFFTINRNIQYQIQGLTEHNQVLNSKSWEEFENFIQTRLKPEMKILRNIRYSYEMVGFKKNKNANSLWVELIAHFNDYNYYISPNGNKINRIIVPYGKSLDKRELLEIAKPIIREAMNQIKTLNTRN